MTGYDYIAWLYDFIASAIFRGSILESQLHHLNLIKPNQKVLIVGGGTGQILSKLDELDIPLVVDFLEPSGQMISRARRCARHCSNITINFHQTRLELFNKSSSYDVIGCFYFLDLYPTSELDQTVSGLYAIINQQGFLLVSDFQLKTGAYWQKTLSRIMHLFFRLTTGLRSKYLKKIEAVILSHNFEKVDGREYFHQFIFSAAYKKNV
ncbi:MAG: methyltransferase [Reichenbachiella sp.]|uniref:class I SAM-dependent methyltransferase n=1 Tax=Reichenbachiella sp. TaxID=2184521 RepID=UPI0032650270